MSLTPLWLDRRRGDDAMVTSSQIGLRALSGRLRRIVGLASLLLVWELNAQLGASRLTPSIFAVAASLVDMALDGTLWFHGRLTLLRGFSGFVIAIAIAAPLGLLLAWNARMGRALMPLLTAAYPVPKLALYPVMLLLLGFGGASKIAMVALECLFPIVFSAYAGGRLVRKDFIWLGQNCEISFRRVVASILVPSALPSILNGIRVAAPIMLIVITVTELLGESRGIGFLISDAQARFAVREALAAILALAIVGFTLDRMLLAVTKHVVFWEASHVRR